MTVQDTTLAPAEAARVVLRRLRAHVACDGGAVVVMDPVTGLFTTGAVDEVPVESCHPFFRSELDDGPRTLRRLAAEGGPATTVSVDVDPDDSFVTQVLAPHGYGAELRAVLRDSRVAWGGVSLWRLAGRPAFGHADLARLERLSTSLGAELRDAVVSSIAGHGPDAEAQRAVFVVADGAVVESSPDLAGLLAEPADPEAEEYRHLEQLVALAADSPRFSAVLGTSNGWLVAHGTPLAEGRVAVTVSTAGPARLLGARVAAAGLSPREVEVTRLLCRGHSDREIARLLGVSEHTAHDHVRSVRRKLDVRSRSEVSALVFDETYFEHFLATAALDHAAASGG